MRAWHFLRDDRRLGYDDGRIVRVGKTIKVKVEPVLCEQGLHASIRLIDALKYAPGPIITLVEIGGEVVKGEDKIVGTERTAIAMIDGAKLLHTFACRIAEKALREAKVEDVRCYDAIKTKLLWLEGKATDADLDAAESAAWSAARSAAWSAAESAAESAAWSAAESAARSAAWSAAESAAESAARSAAWSAAWSAQNRVLTSMVRAAIRKAAK